MKIVAAVVAAINAIPAARWPGSVVPPVYFALAPVTSGGARIRPPYVVVEDSSGEQAELTSGGSIYSCTLSVTVYALGLEQCVDLLEVVRFGGEPVSQRAGLDGAGLTISGGRLHHVATIPKSGRRGLAGFDFQAMRVFLASQEYEVLVAE